MKKFLSVLSVALVFPLFANAAGFELPAGYKPVLDCPAAGKFPHLKVVAQNKKIYLAAKISENVRLFQLNVEDADCGYVTMEAVHSEEMGKLAKLAAYIHINTNDEDLEDPNKAIVTDGFIVPADQSKEQRCKAVGRVRVSDLF